MASPRKPTISGSSAGVTVDLLLGTAFGGDADGDVLSGIERLAGSNRNDVLSGDDENNRLIGAACDDMLIGNDGNDVLRGGAGADVLSGGDGADVFQFAEPVDPLNADTIVDFSASEGDILRLDDARFTALDVGVLLESQFVANLTGLAETVDHHIIFNSLTGQVFYDADGIGGAAAIEIAVSENLAEIDETDISIY